MELIIGIIFLIFGIVFWLGQTFVLINTKLATKLGLIENKEDIDTTFYILESRVVPMADVLLCWTFPLTALLMLLEHPFWAYWGLIGGGTFTYASLNIIISRVILHKKKIRTGNSSSVNAAYIFGTLWTAMGVAMILISLKELNLI